MNNKEIKIGLKRTYKIKPFHMFPVDIIIPFHNQYDKVTRLIENIIKTVHNNRYQITLVDDASLNKDYTKDLSKLGFIKSFRHEEQLGFGAALRTGFKNTVQPWVLFMHSDVVPTDINWLCNLGECLIKWKDKGVKLVSARTNNPMGGDEKLKAEKGTITDDIVSTDYLSLYCALCHRKLFEKINGFIKPYPYCNYEDEELFYRMKAYGFKQGISGKSWVNHEGGATVREILKFRPEVGKIMEENRIRCINDIKLLPKKN